jgi:hypothetical protein
LGKSAAFGVLGLWGVGVGWVLVSGSGGAGREDDDGFIGSGKDDDGGDGFIGGGEDDENTLIIL